MLGPVKFNASADPRSQESHQCGLNYVIVVNEIIPIGFIIGPLDTAPKFRQYHAEGGCPGTLFQ